MKTPRFPKLSPLRRFGLAATSVLALAAGFALASLLFTILLVAGLAMGIWLWWRLRRLTRQARAATPSFIEGEYTIEPTYPSLEDQRTPGRDRLSAASPRRDP